MYIVSEIITTLSWYE